MNNQKLAKIMATLALIGIIISIIGTGLLFIIERNAQEKEIKKQIEEYIKNNSGKIEVIPSTGVISTGNISSGNTAN